MNGIALTVIASQLPALFGFSVQAHGLLDESRQFGLAVASGQSNLRALAIGTASLVAIPLFRRRPRVPIVLMVVVGATLIVTQLDLVASAGVPVLLLGGLSVALISFADTSVLSRTYAGRTASFVDPNQEMVGLSVVQTSSLRCRLNVKHQRCIVRGTSPIMLAAGQGSSAGDLMR